MIASRFAIALASVVLGLAGCAGDGPSGTGGNSQFDAIQQEIFNVSCISGACHNSQTLAGNLNLVTGVSYSQLVGVEPDNLVARQQGLLRVQPFSTSESFLVRKVTQPGLGEGSVMPQGLPHLSPAQIEMITAWIVAGAPAGNDPTPTSTASPIPTETLVPTATDTETPPPTATPTSTETLVPTVTHTPTQTVTGTLPATQTPTLTPTVTLTPTITETATVTLTPTVTETPTITPTATVTPTLTILPGSTLPELQANIFTPRCAVLGCHTAMDAPFNGDLDMEAGATYGQLVNVEPMNITARNKGLLRADPGLPDNSFIVVKVTLPRAGEGSPMPLIGDRLTAVQIEQIRAWIERGALPDEPSPPAAAASEEEVELQ